METKTPNTSAKDSVPSLSEQIRRLEVGETLTRPIDELVTVRALASIESLKLHRRIRTYTDRQTGTITAERTA